MTNNLTSEAVEHLSMMDAKQFSGDSTVTEREGHWKWYERKLQNDFHAIAAHYRRMKEALEELKKYPKGTKCGECGYRLIEHRADIAREALAFDPLSKDTL